MSNVKISLGNCNKAKSTVQTQSESPANFLRKLLQQGKDDNQKNASSYEGKYFTKPSEHELSSYNNDVVAAVRTSNINALRKHHAEGISLNACNRFGESLLHLACRRGNVDVVRFLVQDMKVNILRRDDYGRTPLHDACWTPRPNLQVLEVLLEATDPSLLLAEDVRGHTPFDYSRREHWSVWIKFLKDQQDVLLQRVQNGSEKQENDTTMKDATPVQVAASLVAA